MHFGIADDWVFPITKCLLREDNQLWRLRAVTRSANCLIGSSPSGWWGPFMKETPNPNTGSETSMQSIMARRYAHVMLDFISDMSSYKCPTPESTNPVEMWGLYGAYMAFGLSLTLIGNLCSDSIPENVQIGLFLAAFYLSDIGAGLFFYFKAVDWQIPHLPDDIVAMIFNIIFYGLPVWIAKRCCGAFGFTVASLLGPVYTYMAILQAYQPHTVIMLGHHTIVVALHQFVVNFCAKLILYAFVRYVGKKCQGEAKASECELIQGSCQETAVEEILSPIPKEWLSWGSAGKEHHGLRNRAAERITWMPSPEILDSGAWDWADMMCMRPKRCFWQMLGWFNADLEVQKGTEVWRFHCMIKQMLMRPMFLQVVIRS